MEHLFLFKSKGHILSTSTKLLVEIISESIILSFLEKFPGKVSMPMKKNPQNVSANSFHAKFLWKVSTKIKKKSHKMFQEIFKVMYIFIYYLVWKISQRNPSENISTRCASTTPIFRVESAPKLMSPIFQDSNMY